MKDNFTATEVGTMLESIETKLTLLTEVVAPLPGRLSAVENRLERLETRVGSLEDVIRVAVPTINSRLTHLETKAG